MGERDGGEGEEKHIWRKGRNGENLSSEFIFTIRYDLHTERA